MRNAFFDVGYDNRLYTFDKLNETITYDDFDMVTGERDYTVVYFNNILIAKFNDEKLALLQFFDKKVPTFENISEQFSYFQDIINSFQLLIPKAEKKPFAKYEFLSYGLKILSVQIAETYSLVNSTSVPKPTGQNTGDVGGYHTYLTHILSELRTPQQQIKYLIGEIAKCDILLSNFKCDYLNKNLWLGGINILLTNQQQALDKIETPQQNDNLRMKHPKTPQPTFKWNKNDVDLLELITALAETKAIVNTNGESVRSEIVAFFENVFNMEIKDAESKLSKATERIRSIHPFLDKLIKNFKEYCEKKDAPKP
nr:RteC domain-containing protein [Bacteroidota bacterium]